MSEPKVRVAGVVLCGGRSSRMGQPKAWLRFGHETALERVVRILQEVVAPVVVVAAPVQDLPSLPEDVRVVRDATEHLGPLSGIAAGLQALTGRADAAFITACDVPLLSPRFVAAMVAHLGGHDCAVPVDENFCHPLAGVYRVALAESAGRLVGQGRLRPLFLIDEVRSVRVPVHMLRGVDPGLGSLRNMNTPEDYAALLDMLSTPSEDQA